MKRLCGLTSVGFRAWDLGLWPFRLSTGPTQKIAKAPESNAAYYPGVTAVDGYGGTPSLEASICRISLLSRLP